MNALPAWAKFVAVDADGLVHAFAERPTFKDGVWTPESSARLSLPIPQAVAQLLCVEVPSGHVHYPAGLDDPQPYTPPT